MTSRTITGVQGIVPAAVDKNGRVRSVATLPGYRKGQAPGNKGMRFVVRRLTMLFSRPSGTAVCPTTFCTKHCDDTTCGCSPCFCNPCMQRRISARRPASRPRVRYTPPAPVQGHLFKETQS